MSSQNLDKVVKLACKPKNAPPKPKYVDVLVAATYSDDGSLNDICRSLSLRLKDRDAVVAFKALLTLHQMIRSGSTDQLLGHLAQTDVLKLRNIGSQGFEGYQPPNSMAPYAEYIDVRIRTFRDLKHDLVRVQTESNRRSDGLGAGSKARRLRHLPVDKGLLREVKAVQRILDSLIQCRFYDDDLKDENTILAFRMLIKDLLVLFQAGNEGVCNILEHYFEMSKYDATEAFDIYKSFIKQTDRVVDYLGIARKLHHVINVPVPNLKHAPTGLVKALEEYLNDPNFEDNRKEYRKSLGVVEGRGGSARTPSPAPAAKTETKSESKPASSSLTAAPTSSTSAAPSSAPPGASQKIQDFFDSIQADSQPTMFAGPPQQINYQQMQPAFNPFRQSMMMPQQTGFMQPQMTGFPGGMPQQQQQPFMQPQQTGTMAFGNQPPQMFPPQQQQQQQQPQMFQPTPQQQQPFMQPNQTGFQPNTTGMQSQQTGFLQPQSTGGNPFRQSTMPAMPAMPTTTPNFGAPFSQPVSPINKSSSPFGQSIQRPGSTPATNPLVSQPTGSKNPFAPAPGTQQRAATVSSRGPSMNELAMGFGQSQQQAQGQVQGQGQAQSPWATTNGKSSTNSVGLGDVASSFVFGETKKDPNEDFMAQFGGLSVTTNTNGGGGASTSASNSTSPSTQFNPSLSAFGTSQTQSTGPSSPSSQFLQPQPTGYGGSNIKPFKPTSSFGAQLYDGLPMPQVSSPSPSASPGLGQAQAQAQAHSGGVQSQNTGFPGMGMGMGMGQQQTGMGGGQSGLGQFGAFNPTSTGGGGGFGNGNGNGTLGAQQTGQPNPFRQGSISSPGGGGIGNLGFGGPQGQGQGQNQGLGAFGANSPFAGQNRPPQQNQNQNGGGGGGGGFGGGSLI